ncbi:MAG: methyltransferase domain-containing protein [Bryobacterales bacterium]|nr:methyltransferase domain-containing protein [Bryobacterales bacterium]
MESLETNRLRMREDWNARAREDAQYYVAFGRKQQSADEFFASAADVLRTLRDDLRRFPDDADLSQMTALEIGCGPGRLMLPLSRQFGQVYGIDVSEQMVELARRNLASAPNAEPRAATGVDLQGFDDASIDFVYSYAVFQHIPERDFVLSYLRDAVRVLKPGGLMKLQFNSLPRTGNPVLEPVPGWSQRAGAPPRSAALADAADTWSGCSFQGEELAAFCRDHDLQLLSLEGFDTQYLWMCARKGRPPLPGEPELHIAGAANTFTSDRLVPQEGRFSSAALWIVDLPEGADLNNLRVNVDGQLAAPSYISRKNRIGSGQVNFFLPPGVRTGIVPIQILLDGKPASNVASLRVVPAAPLIPRLLAVSDGVDLLSNLSIVSRTLKVSLEEVPYDSSEAVLAHFRARLDDRAVTRIEAFCVDPLSRRYELNLYLPADVPAGAYNLFCSLGERKFPHVGLHLEA